jgi:hypothetical protein
MRVTTPGMSVNKAPTPMYELATAASEALQSLTNSSVFDAARAALSAPSQSYTTSGFSDSPARTGPVLDPQASLASTVEHTEAVSQSEPPAGSVADRIIANANAEDDSINPMKAGDDGHYKGWKQLQTVFEKTTGWRPSDSECQTITPGRGVLPGGKSWCGIWACHILQQSGVDVKWDLTKGKMVGDVTHVIAPSFKTPAQYKAERSAFEQSIRPGDVITVKGSTNHHAIVTKVNPDGTLETMDGNKPHVGPGRAKLSDVTTYYRPNKD